ncbi:TetR/AcrR family transcriptional regulator [Labrys okinawensis]|uniref:TetR/AcrR family transcriptional regulator n=1 Tax=Labrys okinawensis TaxID=346911 RepID=UPI0039BD842D
MRVSREQAARNKERVIEAADRLFRERGFDGVGIDDLMASAGLTRGGFYKSFDSKEALIETACRQAAERSQRRWDRLLARGEDPLATLVSSYLSMAHRDNPADGCPYAALAGETGRRERPVRGVFREGIEAAVARLSRFMPGRVADRRREQAMAGLATMLGAVVLARAVDDPHLSEEILAAARRVLLNGETSPTPRNQGGG